MIGLLKKLLFDEPVRLEGNLKHTSGNLLSPLVAQNKDLGTALQTLLVGVRLCLRLRLQMNEGVNTVFFCVGGGYRYLVSSIPSR